MASLNAVDPIFVLVEECHTYYAQALEKKKYGGRYRSGGALSFDRTCTVI